jgi:hypothetical protein
MSRIIIVLLCSFYSTFTVIVFYWEFKYKSVDGTIDGLTCFKLSFSLEYFLSGEVSSTSVKIELCNNLFVELLPNQFILRRSAE